MIILTDKYLIVYTRSGVMRKIKITTPENIEVEYTLANLGSRTAAAIIDTAIQSIFVIILLLADYLMFVFSPDFWSINYGWIIGISLLIYGVINYSYFIVMELSMNGKTIGKKVMKLRAIRTNGQPLTLKHSAIRNLLRIFIDMFGIGPVLILFTKDHKRLGDMAASTIVVLEESRTAPVTLEGLLKINEHFSYYLSEEEYELLRDYFSRREDMKDCYELKNELKAYFREKFDKLGILNEWESFIKEL